MTVLVPSCREDLDALLRTAADLEGPALLRFPKGSVITAADLGFEPSSEPALGLSARRLRDGSDVCLLAVGDRVQATLEAARILAEEGYEASVWDVRSVRPADPV